eukprot:3526701-Pyramimonas_sp.AAC.1
MRAERPEEDVRDLKALLRYDELKMEEMPVFSAVDLLQCLPEVEPLAVGAVFKRYAPRQPQWGGHYVLMDGALLGEPDRVQVGRPLRA